MYIYILFKGMFVAVKINKIDGQQQTTDNEIDKSIAVADCRAVLMITDAVMRKRKKIVRTQAERRLSKRLGKVEALSFQIPYKYKYNDMIVLDTYMNAGIIWPGKYGAKRTIAHHSYYSRVCSSSSI